VRTSSPSFKHSVFHLLSWNTPKNLTFNQPWMVRQTNNIPITWRGFIYLSALSDWNSKHIVLVWWSWWKTLLKFTAKQPGHSN
jgi:hypothetical protein